MSSIKEIKVCPFSSVVAIGPRRILCVPLRGWNAPYCERQSTILKALVLYANFKIPDKMPGYLLPLGRKCVIPAAAFAGLNALSAKHVREWRDAAFIELGGRGLAAARLLETLREAGSEMLDLAPEMDLGWPNPEPPLGVWPPAIIELVTAPDDASDDGQRVVNMPERTP